MSWINEAKKQAIDELGTGVTNRRRKFQIALILIGRGARKAIEITGVVVSVVNGTKKAP